MVDVGLTVGERNGDGKRPVVYRRGEQTYPDTVDASSGFQREQSVRRAMAALGIEPDNLPPWPPKSPGWQRRRTRQPTAEGEPKERFPLVSCAALDAADYTPRPIITDCLYAGQPAIDGGMFKTLKTLTAVDAAISIPTGRPFLNTFTVPEPMTVVYFSGEGGPPMMQEYGRRVAASKGLCLADISNLHWCFAVPRLEDLRDLDAMTKVLEATAAEVAIFDNLMLALSGDDAGNVMKMGGFWHGVPPM